MSYPPIEDKNFAKNLLSRKEFFNLKNDPSYDFRNVEDDSPIPGVGLTLHSHQLFVRNFMAPASEYTRLHLMHGTGCHGRNTPILMADGTTKKVQRIVVGDVVMGDYGPKKVTALHRGEDDMFEVVPDYGEPFVVNRGHILSLRCGGLVIDVSVDSYLATMEAEKTESGSFRVADWKLFKLPTEFPEAVYGRQSWAGYVPPDVARNSQRVRREYIEKTVAFHGRVADGFTVFVRRPDDGELVSLLALCRSVNIAAEIDRDDPDKLWIHGRAAADSAFKIEEIGQGKYYGFSVEGNGRYLLGCYTVTHNSGKTLAAVSVATEYIKIYRKLYAAAASARGIGRKFHGELDRATPTVFVLGFGGTRGAFIRELLSYPDFGFVSAVERDELVRRRALAAGGLPGDVVSYKEFSSALKRRVINKSREPGGFYKFYGYDEFVNRLFITGKEVSVLDLETSVTRAVKAGENIQLIDVIMKHVKDGSIQINQQLVDAFENSLLICDEVHNTYNMSMKNKRGVAIQYILDTVPTVRFLSLSATPINGSPTEIVELLGYLSPAVPRLTKSMLFVDEYTLAPGAMDMIGTAVKGKISFLQDTNIKYFPTRKFMGEELVLEESIIGANAGDKVPYLKFVSCPLSEFHQATVDALAAESGPHTVSTADYSIYDIAFPNPDETAKTGLIKAVDLRRGVSTPDMKIDRVIAGSFLRRENIGKYSSKYKKMLDIIWEVIAAAKNNPDEMQKIMIYHNRVKLSGVLLIQEALRENGILDEFSEPVESTICACCAESRGKHNDAHKFIAARFVTAHSHVPKQTMQHSMDKYNAPANKNGHQYLIIVGGKIMKESYDFKDVQNMICMSPPIGIPIFLQILGRCVRKKSHIHLPPTQRKVDVYLLVGVINRSFPSISKVSPEVYRWFDKLLSYKVIQIIERKLNQTAMDGDLHRDIIMPPDLRKEYFPNGPGTAPVDRLGNLYFEPENVIDIDPRPIPQGQLNELTFNAYGYYDEEIKLISYIIKRMFMRQPVWTYEALLAAVHRPPFSVEVNPALFAEGNFIIALYHLVTPSTPVVSAVRTERHLVDKLFDYNDRNLYKDEVKYRVEHIGQYYIAFPVSVVSKNPINVVHADYAERLRDREIANLKLIKIVEDRVEADVETYLRPVGGAGGMRVSISQFMQDSKIAHNFDALLKRFIVKYEKLGTNCMFGLLTEYNTPFQTALLDLIISEQKIPTGLYGRVIDLYNKFDIIVYAPEVTKYPDVAKQLHALIGTKISSKIPLGYMVANSVRLWNGTSWFEVNKIAMNRHVNYRENDIIVGYLESFPDGMKFKLRRPVQAIQERVREGMDKKRSTTSTNSGSRKIVGDTRLVERGIVCSTKNKTDLLRILSRLGVSVAKIKESEARVRNLCDLIRMELYSKEIKERAKGSRVKWIYSFWSTQLLPTYT